MKACRIISYLTQASQSDIFKNGEGAMFENKEIFYKSQFSGKFEGPYLLNNNLDYFELMVQISTGMIYVLDSKNEAENNYPFEMILREASAEDIKESKNTLKVNMSFYLFAKNENITGPFYLLPKMDIKRLKKDLDDKIVFILAKKQTFKRIETKIAV